MKSKLLSIFIILCISTVALLFAHGNMSKATIGFLQITKNLTITPAGLFNAGSDGNGIDVNFFTDTAGEEMLWDASANGMFLDGANGSDVLTISDGDLNLTDNALIGGTLGVTGVTTLTGGVAYATNAPFNWSAGGSVALATAGTNSTPTDGPRMWVEIFIPRNVTLTGIGYLVGTVGGTDSVVVELFDSAGAVVARSIATDTEAADLVATLAEFQKVNFSSTVNVVAGTHYISVQFNGGTARVRTFGIPNSGFVANTAAGTFKTAASITPTTTFVVGEGPISWIF